MKKLISLSVFLLLIAFTNTTLLAQNAADVTATAEVVVPLEVTNQQNLEFGQVLQDDTRDLVTADNAGRIRIGGSEDASIDVELTAIPTALTGIGVPIPIANFAISSSADAGNLGTDFSTFTQGDIQPLTLTGTSELFVFFRGSITPATDQAAGTYNETFTITVNYN